MIVVHGADELAAKCERIGSRLENPEGASDKVTAAIRQRIERQFATDGEGAWPGHAPATVERWGEHATLRLTGALQAALTGGTARSEGGGFRYEPTTDLFYGSIVTRRRPVVAPGDDELAGEVAEAIATNAFEGS